MPKLISRTEQALLKRDFFIQQHNQQILQLMQQLNATDQLIDQIDKQIKIPETLIKVNEKLLATGDIRLIGFYTYTVIIISMQGTW